MHPKIWGSHAWVFIHSIGYSYPDNPSPIERTAIENFLKSLQHILPCKTCSALYKKDIPKLSLQITQASENKSNLIKWINEMHNKVNKNLNKKEFTDKEFDLYYNNSNKLNNSSNMKKILFIIFIIIVLILFYIFI